MDEERRSCRASRGSSSPDDNMIPLASFGEGLDDERRVGDEEEHGAGTKGVGLLPGRPAPRAKPRRPHYWKHVLYRPLLPDAGLSIRGHAVLEAAGVATRLLKFIILTFVSIVLVHVVVADLSNDRDKNLQLSIIWRYEADLIVRDCVVFFAVGRLWDKTGVDHLAWMGTTLLANVYFESQNFVWFLHHSVTLFEMHCLWPWQLWLYALALLVVAAGLVIAHALHAWQERAVVAKLTEVGLCVLFFVAPMVASDFFHLHHWYAGWLLGMHCNYNKWWSQMAMAWCWGMYINGIAVYGRDPVLSCEYAYRLTLDGQCPYASCYLDGLEAGEAGNHTEIEEMIPADWRNCSETVGFRP